MPTREKVWLGLVILVYRLAMKTMRKAEPEIIFERIRSPLSLLGIAEVKSQFRYPHKNSTQLIYHSTRPPRERTTGTVLVQWPRTVRQCKVVHCTVFPSNEWGTADRFES